MATPLLPTTNSDSPLLPPASLLGTFVFLLVRCICLCQGNRFCPSPTEQTESYSGPPPKRNRDLLVMKVIIVALAAGALVGVVLGFVGTNKATTTIDGLIQVTVKEMGIDVLKDQLEMMENLVDDILYLADGPSTSWDLGLANLPSTMDDITDEVNSVVEEVEDYEVLANDILGYLEIAGIVIMSLIIIMILIAVAGAALESRGLLICPLVTVPVWIVFSWVLYTAFNTVHTFIDDACRWTAAAAQCPRTFLSMLAGLSWSSARR